MTDARVLRSILEQKGICDERVLDAIEATPRARFVPATLRGMASEDMALPIGLGQSISQPFVVATTCVALAVRPGDRLLDVGTGSGYAAAVLARLGAEVYSIEILPALLEGARQRLGALGLSVRLKLGDGTFGWPAAAPFTGIAVGAAPREIPKALVEQLARPGRLVIPVGGPGRQRLLLIEQDAAGRLETRALFDVQFVPLLSPPAA